MTNKSQTTMKFEDVAEELKRIGVDLHYSPSDGALPACYMVSKGKGKQGISNFADNLSHARQKGVDLSKVQGPSPLPGGAERIRLAAAAVAKQERDKLN